MDRTELLASPKLKPVMIRKGSLGKNLPDRDMMVSPNHRMLIVNTETQLLFDQPEVLVAAKHLTRHEGIFNIDVPEVDYIHILFDEHQVVLADGAWTESFQPGGQSLPGFDKDQQKEIFTLFPELANVETIESYKSARHTLKTYEAALLERL